MRICFYSHTAFFEGTLSLIPALAERADVHLIVEVTPGSWHSSSFDVPPQALPEGPVPADGILAPFFPAAVRDRWACARSFTLAVHRVPRSLHPASVRVGRKVLRFVRDLDPDVLHIDDVDVTPRLPLALPFLRGVPIVISVHDPEPHSGERNWRKSLGRRLAFPRARRFVLYNRSLATSFAASQSLPPERVRAVRFGPFDLFRAWDPGVYTERFPTILFFGRISPYKGIEDLYAALPAVVQRVPNLRVVVAGRPISGYTPPPPPPLPPPASIELIDRYIRNEEVPRLFSESSLVVCPYRDATQSGVLLTAYAFERPVVATAVGGIGDYVFDGLTGSLVPPADPVALAEALIAALTDDAVRSRLRKGVREAMEGPLSWSTTAESLRSIYSEVARHGP